METGVTLVIAAVLGAGTLWFIQRRFSVPAGLDAVVTVVAMGGALLLASGVTGTLPEGPASQVPPDTCVEFPPPLPGMPCMTVGQVQKQACYSNFLNCMSDDIGGRFAILPWWLYLPAFGVGMLGGEYVHRRVGE